MADKTPLPFPPDAVTLLAIAKAVKEKQLDLARAAVKPGIAEINKLVRFRGTLSVGVDTPGGPGGNVPASFDPWLLLQMLLDRKGAPSVETLSKRAADADEEEKAAALALPAQFRVYSAKLLPQIAVNGSAPKRGSVSFAGVVEVVPE